MEKIILIGTQAALDAKRGLIADAKDFDITSFAFNPAAFGKGFFGRLSAKRAMKQALALRQDDCTIILLDDPQGSPWPFWMVQYLQRGLQKIAIPERLETTFTKLNIELSGFCIYSALNTPADLDNAVRGALFRMQSHIQHIR